MALFALSRRIEVRVLARAMVSPKEGTFLANDQRER